jgi:hypothetical protein
MWYFVAGVCEWCRKLHLSTNGQFRRKLHSSHHRVLRGKALIFETLITVHAFLKPICAFQTFQCVSVSYVYGLRRFADDIEVKC